MGRLTFRYSPGRLLGDYLRSAIGLGLTGLPATQLPPDGVGFWILLVFALMFVGLGAHTVRRQLTRIVMSDEKIESFPGRIVIEWKDLREVKLSYFSTRTDRKNGWMQLTINTGNRKLRVDSRIDDFPTIASKVLDQTTLSRVVLSETTSSNFEALGLDIPGNPRGSG